MKLKYLEKRKDKAKIEVKGATHTLLNLLRENAWKAGASQASYIIEHPYLSDPQIIIKSNKAKKVLNDSAQFIIDDSEAFKREFRRALKR